MKVQVIKYIRIAEDKKSLILLPSKIGIDIIKRVLDTAKISYTETIEKIDKSNLIAISISFGSELRYFKYDVGMGGIVNIYVYTEKEDKIYMSFPFEI